jgi:hypothetical protein
VASGTGWKDQLVSASGAGAGAVAPSFGNLSGNLSFWRGYTMAATGVDELHVVFHPNHDYKPGSTVNLHVHWSPTVAAAGDVVFGFQYSFARGYSVDAFPASSTVTVTQAASGSAYTHQIAETADLTIANFETDGLLLVRVYRDGDNVADTYGSPIALYTIDMHYQSDRDATTARNRGTGWDP